MKPKNNPFAASEKATGKPDNKNITSQVIKDAKQWYNNRFGDHEQAIIDYNKMEEESEMDDYNNLSND
jgi:hypothetical protein